MKGSFMFFQRLKPGGSMILIIIIIIKNLNWWFSDSEFLIFF